MALTNFLSNIADAIRIKEGTSSEIPANDFHDRILALSSGEASSEWQPDPTWAQDLRTWTQDGAIGLIVSNMGFGKLSFIATTVGNAEYTVVVNNGTTDISTTNYASGAVATVDVGMGDGNTTYAVKVTSTAQFTRWYIRRPADISIIYDVPLLWFYGNLTSLNTCDSMFCQNGALICSQLQSVYIKSTSNVTSMSNMFSNCYGLELISPLEMANATVTNSMFNNCFSLKNLQSAFDTSNVTNMSNMFQYCYGIESIPSMLNLSKVTNMTSLINTNFRLIGSLDLSSASLLTKLTAVNSPKLNGLIAPSFAPWSGSSPQIDITNCGLDRTALIALFNSLGTVTSKTIKVTGNRGVAGLTASDLLIATNKGWTVTTA